MAFEKRFRRITLLYLAILLMNCLILVKGQKNLRKEESPNENSDNYIILYLSGSIEYSYNKQLFAVGNYRDMVSYVKYFDTEVHRNSNNEIPAFTVTNQNNPEITLIPLEIHFSSCVSSLGEFFHCIPSGTYDFDYNYDKFKEVDFSHFDSSCLESTERLFYIVILQK